MRTRWTAAATARTAREVTHEKWHVAYDEALRVPLIVSSPLLPGGARELEIPTNHADLIPTLLGLTGIDHDQALAKLKVDHVDARPLVGRDLSDAIRAARPAALSEPVLLTTDDEISEGSMPPKSPVQRVARLARVFSTVKQPNHLKTVIAEVPLDGQQHVIKFSRYYDNPQFWTVPGERDERLHGRKRTTDDTTRALQQTMLGLLVEQLAAKRLAPSAGERPGYRPPKSLAPERATRKPRFPVELSGVIELRASTR